MTAVSANITAKSGYLLIVAAECFLLSIIALEDYAFCEINISWLALLFCLSLINAYGRYRIKEIFIVFAALFFVYAATRGKVGEADFIIFFYLSLSKTPLYAFVCLLISFVAASIAYLIEVIIKSKRFEPGTAVPIGFFVIITYYIDRIFTGGVICKIINYYSYLLMNI